MNNDIYFYLLLQQSGVLIVFMIIYSKNLTYIIFIFETLNEISLKV